MPLESERLGKECFSHGQHITRQEAHALLYKENGKKKGKREASRTQKSAQHGLCFQWVLLVSEDTLCPGRTKATETQGGHCCWTLPTLKQADLQGQRTPLCYQASLLSILCLLMNLQRGKGHSWVTTLLTSLACLGMGLGNFSDPSGILNIGRYHRSNGMGVRVHQRHFVLQLT